MRSGKEHKSQILILSFAVECFLLLAFLCCKESPVEPLIVLRNPREYTWSIDTVLNPRGGGFLTAYDISGPSPTNLYLTFQQWTDDGLLFHFDGARWTPIHTPFIMTTYYDIKAFSSENIWIVGDWNHRSLLIHFDGISWSEVQAPKLGALTTMWGNPTDLWFGGLNGALLHYDGISVQKDSVPMAIPDSADPFYDFGAGASFADKSYLSLRTPLGSYLLFERNDGSWALKQSTSAVFSLWLTPSGKLFLGGEGIYTPEGDISARFTDSGIYCMNGVSDENVFAVGFSQHDGIAGEIYHWNGTDWYHFNDLPTSGVAFTSVWTDGREVFVVGGISGKFLVFHGK